jgi:cytidylate kinase
MEAQRKMRNLATKVQSSDKARFLACTRVLDQLMKDIGFESGYVVQGGDIGSRIARHLGVDHS